MVLKGQQGAVHFIWYTGIFDKKVENEFASKGDLNWKNISGDPTRPHWWALNKAMGADVGTHTPHPQHEGHSMAVQDCEWLDNRPCYCDGSALLAQEWFEILRKEGSDKIWELLEERYVEEFGKLI